MDYINYFDPSLLLGDRVEITLYAMYAEAYLTGNYQKERELYIKFLQNFNEPEHNPEVFNSLIHSIATNGFRKTSPVYCNPENYSLLNGSHRCGISVALGIDKIPYNLRFVDNRVSDDIYIKIFTSEELTYIMNKRDFYINKANPEVAFKCKLRLLMRKNYNSFQAPFSSFTKVPSLRFYQQFEKLGLSGKRPAEKRFSIYGLEPYLTKSMSVLEIGCNVGFFSLVLKDYVRHIDAFDIDEVYVQVANQVADYLKATNKCNFYVSDVTTISKERTYDLVVSTAVHGWTQLPFTNYLSIINSLVSTGGLLLFESHELDATSEKDWPQKKEELLQHYDLLENGLIDDTEKEMYESEMREFLLLKKKY